MRTLIAALAAIVTAYAFIPASQAADPSESFYGIWKGTMHVSGAKVQTFDANIVVCLGPKFKIGPGEPHFGWMNRHSESFGARRNVTLFITSFSVSEGAAVLVLKTSLGTQHMTLKHAGEGKLLGSTDFQSDDPSVSVPIQGNLSLISIDSVGKHCPPANKRPAS